MPHFEGEDWKILDTPHSLILVCIKDKSDKGDL